MMNKLRLLPFGIVVVCLVALSWYGAIPQYDDYHLFADTRFYFAVPNAMDVLSNIVFGLVSLLGVLAASFVHTGKRIQSMHGMKNLGKAEQKLLSWQLKDLAYLVFSLSIFMTCFGSAYYHWAPDDGRLFWDRLPIACACATLLAAVRIETQRIHQPMIVLANVVAMLLIALISVVWWQRTGDLRLYLALQILAIVLIPLWQTIYPTCRQTRLTFAIALCLYVLAKIAEILDPEIFILTTVMSGHTLKHLLAGVAAALIMWHWCGVQVKPKVGINGLRLDDGIEKRYES